LAPLVSGTRPETNDTPEPLSPSIQLPPGTIDKIVTVWRNNTGFGPSQVHYQLRRVGVKVDTKTIRKVMIAHGYRPPRAKPPRPEGEVRRFGASRLSRPVGELK